MGRYKYSYYKKQKYSNCKRHKCAYAKQCCFLRHITYCMPELTIVERIFKWIICALGFLDIIPLIVRSIIHDDKKRKDWIDIYVILVDILFPAAVLIFKWQYHFGIMIAAKYLIFTTLVYILGVVFLDDVYEQPFSPKRSILLLLINYVGITLFFAILYLYFDAVKGVNGETACTLQAVYFSFVTSTTLGFGDYKPINTAGQILVILQVCIFLLFIVVFFNHFMSLKKKEDC